MARSGVASRFPHETAVLIRGKSYPAGEIIERLTPFISEDRRARIAHVVSERTYSVVPVMEGLYDRGNISAVLRSAETLGFQAAHIIQRSKKLKVANRVTQGAEKWLDVERWRSTSECTGALRERGYRILATHTRDAQPIHAFDFSVPTAVVFGNEHEGVSDELLAAADARVVVPMPGFTRSFNISVAAALCLYHIRMDRIRRIGAHGDLDEIERERLTAEYYRRSLANAEELVAHLSR